MNIFLLENDKSVDLLTPELFNPATDVIVCFNALVAIRLRREQRPWRFVFLEELLTAGDYDALHQATDEFAMRWYRLDGEDRTVFDGISYGAVTQIMFSRLYMLSVLVKYGEVIRKAVQKWSGVRTLYHDFTVEHNFFYLWQDDGGRFFHKPRLVELVAGQLGVQTVHLRCPEPTPSAHMGTGHREAGVETSAAKRLFRMATGLRERGVALLNAREPGVYLFAYFNLLSLVQATAGAGGRRYILSDYPGATPKEKLSTLLSTTRVCRFDDINYTSGAREQAFLSAVQAFFLSQEAVARRDSLYCYEGIHYGEFYERALRDILTVKMPQLLHTAGQIRRAIEREHIRSMVLIDTLDQRNRLIVEICRHSGVRTLFVDHGMMGMKHAQRVADRALPDCAVTAGPAEDPYDYRSRGVELAALGNPCLDAYPPQRRKTVGALRKVLFLTYEDNFYSRMDRFSWQERYYEEIFSAFPALMEMGVEIHYRPHFENRAYHRHLFRFFGVDESAVHYSEGGAFSRLIYDMDLLVCNFSSCFYEAQAAGVPAVLLEPHFNRAAVLPPLDGTPYDDVLRIATGRELVDIVQRNRQDAAELRTFLDRFLAEKAPPYMGAMDGQAGKRITAYIAHHL